MTKQLIVTPELADVRLDHYLTSVLPNLTRNQIQQLIKTGRVTKQVKPLKKSYLVQVNDELQVELPDDESTDLIGEEIPLNILYEDDTIAIINKPRNLVVHPAPGHATGTLVHALIHHVESLSNPTSQRPGIVHRMDKDTTGLLLITKTQASYDYFQKKFHDHDLTRIYWAIVHGRVKFDELTIDQPIGRSPSNRKRFTIDPAGRRAVTHVRTLETFTDFSLVECRLETGRTHQIRVHLKSINHPVVGDPAYGPKKSLYTKQGQFLHAKQLAFVHPNGQAMNFDSPLPADMEDFLNRLRRKQFSR